MTTRLEYVKNFQGIMALEKGPNIVHSAVMVKQAEHDHPDIEWYKKIDYVPFPNEKAALCAVCFPPEGYEPASASTGAAPQIDENGDCACWECKHSELEENSIVGCNPNDNPGCLACSHEVPEDELAPEDVASIYDAILNQSLTNATSPSGWIYSGNTTTNDS